jgi:hypothetical protein
MKNLAVLSLCAYSLLFTNFALADSDGACHVDKNEWVSKEAVTKKLESEGWKVRKIKMEDGCFEAYALKGDERAEILLNPKTLEVVKIKEND